MMIPNKRSCNSSMEDLPEALLGEIIKRLPTTSDLNSLSLVSKQLYTIEAQLRDAIHIGCGVSFVSVALVSLCSRFQNLRKVEFNYSGWTPNGGMQLDNQGLHVFSSSCHSLTDLTLNFCSDIDDSGLVFLACFKKLMFLRLNRLPRITSSGLLSVAVGCKSLSVLHLICCNNVGSVEWLEHLGRIGSLEELVVKNCERIGQFNLLSFGSGLTKLQRFEFQSSYMPNKFNGHDRSYVAGNQSRYDFCCDGLKDLTLARITTSAEIGLGCLLSKCKALENLCLYYVLGVHDNDMITLAQNSRSLRSISLMLTPEECESYVYRTSLTDESLKALSLYCPMLQSVELTFFGCEPDWPEIGFTQDGLVTLIQSCPVRDLTLSGANIFDDKGMKALSDAQFLESLRLVNCIAITDAGMRLLARSRCLINLTLELCNGLTDDGVAEFVRARKLESLTIEKCSHISQNAVQGAAKTVRYTDDCPGFKNWVEHCVLELHIPVEGTMRMPNKHRCTKSMEGLPEALLEEIIKLLPAKDDLTLQRCGTAQGCYCIGRGYQPGTAALVPLWSRFQNLRKVEFNYSGWMTSHGMQLNNEGLRVFSSCCHSLADLTLSFCSCIDDSGLDSLACCKKLTSLRLNTLPRMMSSGLLSVAVGCKSLSALHLISCENVRSVEWLEYLGRTGSLEELVVKNCEKISQFDLLSFGLGWMKLQRFEFQNSCMPTKLNPHEHDPSSVAGHESRYDFCCNGFVFGTDHNIYEIGLCCLLSKCRALENLCLYYVLGVHDNDMITLAQNSRSLRRISLMLTPQEYGGHVYRTSLTDESLKALSLYCPMLQSVELTFFGCESYSREIGFTQEGLVTLIQLCPIRDLTLSGAEIFGNEGMRALSDAQFLESLRLVKLH
ncbi:LOW QUALITY PROTEIN: hypothetical protein U9M48_025557 [Paspalum notatum var. saurae]|uniref:F-box domain-containing protein n=1 Tax=Paspalum notatum var. saurae TaxID=547442 RepID=A0AAQ3TQB8_PASNO